MTEAPSPPRRRSRVLWRAGVAAGALVALEVLCRLLVPLGDADYMFQGYTLWDRMTLRWDAARGTVEWAAYDDMRVSVSAEGYRRAPRPPAPDGAYRVACMGDSRAFGMWVDDGETWCRGLEPLLERRLGRPVRSFNFGVMGSTPYIAVDSVLDDVLAAEPDLVVLAYSGLNSSCLVPVAEADYTGEDRSLQNALRSSRVYQILETAYHLARLRFTGGERVPKVPLDEFGAHLRTLRDRSRAAGAEVLFVVQWSPHPDVPGVFSRERFERYRALTLEIAAERGSPVLDARPLFEGEPARELFVENGIHYSAQGNRRLAEEIAERVPDGGS